MGKPHGSIEEARGRESEYERDRPDIRDGKDTDKD